MRARSDIDFTRLRGGADWQAAVRVVGEYADDDGRPGADPTAPGTSFT